MVKPITDPVRTNTKAPNYSEADVALLETRYSASPTAETVENLVEILGKPKKSIIAKLSHMGIYVTPARVTKTGAPIVKKDDLVSDIEKHMGSKYPSLVKANKRDLVELLEDLTEHFGDLA